MHQSARSFAASRDFNGNPAAQRYSPLDQINASNVSKLAIAWRRQAGMFGPNPELENVCPCTHMKN